MHNQVPCRPPRLRLPVFLRAVAPAVVLAVGAAGPGPARARPSADVLEALRRELPDDLAALGGPDALEGAGAAGRWFVASAQMDGRGGEEAVLVVLPAGKPGSIRFAAERSDDDPKVEKISLKGRPIERADVAFPVWAPGRALLHVDAGEGGQGLFSWDGQRFDTVWRPGKAKADEMRWFVLEDLDGDGASEIVIYFRRQLGVWGEDEVTEEIGGADDRTLTSGKTDAIEAYRIDEGRWKRDDSLLESRR